MFAGPLSGLSSDPPLKVENFLSSIDIPTKHQNAKNLRGRLGTTKLLCRKWMVANSIPFAPRFNKLLAIRLFGHSSPQMPSVHWKNRAPLFVGRLKPLPKTRKNTAPLGNRVSSDLRPPTSDLRPRPHQKVRAAHCPASP